MPCIIKQQTSNSPGIITFTHNEILWGLPNNSLNVKNFLHDSNIKGKWLFGVHIQGDCSFLANWPIASWQSFVMWPDKNVSFLNNLPINKFCPFTCINFMPAYLSDRRDVEKLWDICVISRASSLKRIENTLLLLRSVLDRRPETKIIMIIPDPRHLELGEKAYKKQGIDEVYFKLPRKLFTAKELKQISFISSSQDSFGNFPLDGELIAEILQKSKFLFLNSFKEGVPRVIAESLMLGTPCIISDQLRSGLNNWLTEDNSLKIPDEPTKGADLVLDGLKRYGRFNINRENFCSEFSETINVKNFKNYLSNLIQMNGADVNGQWFLEDLHLRLACHGQKQDFQFFHNEKLFFKWIDQVSKLENSDINEDFLVSRNTKNDSPSFCFQFKQILIQLFHRLIKYLIKLTS